MTHSIQSARQGRLGEPRSEEWENILLDPSLLVSRVRLAKLREEPETLREQEVAAHYFVPGGFFEMLNRFQDDAVNTRCWKYFADKVAPAAPSEILSTLRRMQTSVFELPRLQPVGLENFSATKGLSGADRRDEFLVSVLNQEAAFLATHSMILARVQKAFDALVKGGLVGLEGLEGFLSQEVIDRLKKYGWRRLCKNVGIPIAGVWAGAFLPALWPQIIGTAVVLLRLDP